MYTTKKMILIFRQCFLIFLNRDLGNDRRIPIGCGNETSILEHWIQDLPLKVITHGWLSSDYNYTGVFTINTGIIK